MLRSRISLFIWVGLSVVALTGVLLAAGPMRGSEYKGAAARYVEEMYTSEDEIWDALRDIATSSPNRGETRIEARDVAQIRSVYREKSAAFASAASRLKELRAPLACKQMDENLRAWIALQEGECLRRYGSLADQAAGMTYDELDARLEELDRSIRFSDRSVILGFGSAIKELDVDLSH